MSSSSFPKKTIPKKKVQEKSVKKATESKKNTKIEKIIKKSTVHVAASSLSLADTLVLNSKRVSKKDKMVSKLNQPVSLIVKKTTTKNRDVKAPSTSKKKVVVPKVFGTLFSAHHKKNKDYIESIVEEIEEDDKQNILEKRIDREKQPRSTPLNKKYIENQQSFSQTRNNTDGQKKDHHRITLTAACLALLIVVGSYVTPRSSAESVIFYPSSCLGGWVNPHNVEGIPQVEGNNNEEKFTEENSAILAHGTNADIYCGGFVGEFKKNTKPSKVIVALSWAKGKDTKVEKVITGESFASSSTAILDTSSSSPVSFTLATTTEVVDSTSSTFATTTLDADTNKSDESATPSVLDSDLIKTPGSATDTSGDVKESTTEAASTQSVNSTTNEDSQTKPVPEVVAPLSLRAMFINTILAQIGVASVYADEVVEQQSADVPPPQIPADTTTQQPAEVTPTTVIEEFLQKTDDLLLQKIELPSISNSTTTEVIPATPLFDNTSTSSVEALLDFQSTTSTSSPTSTSTAVSAPIEQTVPQVSNIQSAASIVSDSKGEDNSENNFLRILYTFDGITWSSLGNVNEESLVYRTFEIPITATTSWDDLSKVQIKVESIGRIDPTPTVYLDGMKVEVLYDTPTIHEHPDFSRDTVLMETTEGIIRVVNIINSDTNNKEIWYIAPRGEGGLAAASSTWVKVDQEAESLSYRLVEIYEKNLFWVDDIKKNLWTIDLDKNVTNNVPILVDATTTVPFTKANGEPWAFDYNFIKKTGLLRYRIVPQEVKTLTIIKVDGNLKIKKLFDGTQDETLVITPPADGNISIFSDVGTIIEYIAVSEEPHSVPVQSLPSGISVLLFTTRVDGCASLSLIECKFDHGYSGEVKLLVTNGSVVTSNITTATSTVSTVANEP